MKEQEIRRQFRAAVNIQNKQYKILKEQLLTRTSKADQKAMLAKLKEEQDRRLSMLSDQYEQSISEVKQHQHVSIECMVCRSAHEIKFFSEKFLSWNISSIKQTLHDSHFLHCINIGP